MDEKDRKVRKQWLYLLITLSTSYALYTLFQSPLASVQLPLLFKYSLIAYMVVVPLVIYFMLYRCAYKKPGTKFLTFLLISAPIVYIGGSIATILEKLPLPNDAWSWAYTIFQSGLGIWWYFLHWKMRAINKKLKNTAPATPS